MWYRQLSSQDQPPHHALDALLFCDGNAFPTVKSCSEFWQPEQTDRQSCLLYVMTRRMWSVGYGHIAPKTSAGMMVTMLYAIVGIPLTLLTITNLGRMLATAFRFLYRNIFSIICCTAASRPQQPETLPLHVTRSTSGHDHGNTM